jgi:hypothetical protein
VSGWVDPLEIVRYSLTASAEYQQLAAGRETYVVQLLKGLRRIAKEVQLLSEANLSRHHLLDVQRTTNHLVLSDSALNERPDL